MSTVIQIEEAISKLSQPDRAEVRDWFRTFDADAWDRQIEDDAANGRLRALYQKLESENSAQPEIPLDAFLDNEKLS